MEIQEDNTIDIQKKKEYNKTLYKRYIKPKLDANPEFKAEYNYKQKLRQRRYYENPESRVKKQEYYKVLQEKKKAEKIELEELRKMLTEFKVGVKAIL
jgi:hypothetical protein